MLLYAVIVEQRWALSHWPINWESGSPFTFTFFYTLIIVLILKLWIKQLVVQIMFDGATNMALFQLFKLSRVQLSAVFLLGSI